MLCNADQFTPGARSLRRAAFWALAAALALGTTIQNGYAQGGPPGESVGSLTIDPSTPATLYAGTAGFGAFKSTNGGTSWSAVNSGLTARFVHTLAIDPSTPATLYAGTNGGGVFKSTNGGATWQPTGANFGNGSPPATAISKVSGNNQTGNVSQLLTFPLVAVVTNADGIPVAGVAVDFAVTAGGGTLSGTQSTTDSQGVAFTSLTLGPIPGIDTVTATASGLTGSPLTFTAGLRRRRGQLIRE